MLGTPVAVSDDTASGPAPATTVSSAADGRTFVVAERVAWSLVWLAVLTGGVDVWGFWWSSPLVVVLAPAMVVAGVIGTAWCWLVTDPRGRAFQAVGFLCVMVTALFPQAIVIHTRIFYKTDAAAFDHVAARALMHGTDPYTMSMSAAAHFLQVPDRFWTYTITGGHVSHFSYPAGSFLLYIPAFALGFRHMVVDWVDLMAWMVTGVLLFVLVRAPLRWVAALVVLTPALLGEFGTGGTDAVFLPFLVLAVWRWDRYGRDRGAGVARWIGPVALGLACAVKQTPWFCVPLLASGVFLEARRTGRPATRLVARYLATVAGVFGAVNLPFVVWQPGAWWRGTVLPFVGGLVADGQGLVTLATHGITGGVDLTMLSLAGVLSMVAIVCAFVVCYPSLKRVAILLLPIVFFFSARSLSSYLIDLFPVAVVAALTVDAAPPRRPSTAGPSRARATRLWPTVTVAVPSMGAVIVSALAFAAPPLQLAVRSVVVSRVPSAVRAVTVAVRNRTSATLTPHFMVNTGDQPDGFWTTADHRPVELGPHRSTTVTLYAPVTTPAPQIGARWLVEAYTSRPAALSTSPLELFTGGGPVSTAVAVHASRARR